MSDQEQNNQENSTYSYSYRNQENKDPNLTWKASENTSSGQANYNQSNYNANNENAGAYTNHNYSTGTNSYGNAGANQGGGYNYNGSYNYQGQQTKKTSRFSNWSDKVKRQKKSGNRKIFGQNGSSFGKTIGKCLVIAIIFGLVAGGCFTAVVKIAGVDTKITASNDDSSTSNTSSDVQLNTDGDVELADLSSVAGDVSKITKAVMPSIVAITNMGETQMDWFGQTYTEESESSGSGVIISQDDDYLYIATNNHVVENAVTITVAFADDTTATAEVKGTDSSTDLAVVSIALDSLSKDTLSKISIATIGDSDTLAVGDSAIAIGNALGYGQSVTTGVISALNREVTLTDETSGESITNELIQTDAAINPGNSGGALLNSKGEVIGINSSKYSDTSVEGMGFAIPMSKAQPILNDLITREVVDESESAYFGIRGVDVTTDAAQQYNMPEGIYIAMVASGSAAEKAGLQVGDILTKFDGKDMTSYSYLQEQMQYYKAGDKVEIVISRASDGIYKEKKLTVTMGSKN